MSFNPSKSRPALAVDTSFSRHQGQAPQPKQQEQLSFISLHDIRSLGDNTGVKAKTKGTKKKAVGKKLKDVSAKYGDGSVHKDKTAKHVAFSAQPTHSKLQAPALHSRIKGLRPSPLQLDRDVSPSDRNIPIGIAVPSAALSNHTQSPLSAAPHSNSPPRSARSQQHGQELPTPTIVITPAKEDFEGIGRSPEESTYSSRSVPAYERTPPVPRLPSFAAQSNASLRKSSRESTATHFEEDEAGYSPRSRKGLSLHTTFEQDVGSTRSAPLDSEFKRRSSQNNVPTPRRSKGWWNVLTSPFATSAKSTTFSFRSQSIREEDENQPILSGASEMGYSDHSGVIFTNRASDDDELRSAPLTDCSSQQFGSGRSVRTPQRSGTAPGALDIGNANEMNIYGKSGDGAASSYYEGDVSSPAMVGSRAPKGARSLGGQGEFDPRQSCYQEPRGIDTSLDGDEDSRDGSDHDHGLRDSEFYRVPSEGEAAPYYDSNRMFPSGVPYGGAYGDRGMENWSPRQSVSREPSENNLGVSGDRGGVVESPSTSSRLNPFADVQSERDYGSDGSPFNNAQTPATNDYSRAPAAQGRVVERSPFDSGQAAEFEGFSAAYTPGERRFFSTPTKDELKGRTSDGGLTTHYGTQGVQSPMSETTPILENAHMATYMGPQSSNGELREVDVASTRTQTPRQAGPGTGLGNATMASRAVHENYQGQSIDMESEKSVSYQPRPQHSRNDSQGLGISDDGSEDGLFPPPRSFSEKADPNSSADQQGQVSDRNSSQPLARRIAWIILGLGLALVVLLAVLLVVFLPYPYTHMPVQAAWVNTTGFPPLPTGIATVIQPKAVEEVSGCVDPPGLWTCALPAADRKDVSSNKPDQPNFRFEIRFRNHTLSSNETALLLSNNTMSKRSLSQAAQAGALVRRNLLINTLYTANPSTPSDNDQIFLGRTTDNISEPYNGEETPFYISVLDASTLTTDDQTTRVKKRDSGFKYPYPSVSSAAPKSTQPVAGHPKPSSTQPFLEAPTSIPQPDLKSDGKAAAAELYPLAYAQPLRLFNRGQDSEHYGFYTYFDRSLFVLSKSNVTTSSNNESFGGAVDGNVPREEASAICTWSQTRMMVQIWTRRAEVNSLNTSASPDLPAFDSSANDMTAPGSFPYPVTITLDRHGGQADKKAVYCYELEEEHQIVKTMDTWIDEDRRFGGTLRHPAVVPTNSDTSLRKRGIDEGRGIDGGTGGCSCQWQNWA